MFKRIGACLLLLIFIVLSLWGGIHALKLYITEGKGIAYDICDHPCNTNPPVIFYSPHWKVLLFTALNVFSFILVIPTYVFVVLMNVFLAFRSDKFKWIGPKGNGLTTKLIGLFPFILILIYILLKMIFVDFLKYK